MCCAQQFYIKYNVIIFGQYNVIHNWAKNIQHYFIDTTAHYSTESLLRLLHLLQLIKLSGEVATIDRIWSLNIRGYRN